MARHPARSANRPLLVQRVHLWWYVVALVPILGLGWLVLNSYLPGILLRLILFASIFWVASFVMAIIAKLRRPRPESRP